MSSDARGIRPLTLTECPWFARIQSSSAPSWPVGSACRVNRCFALSRTIRSSVSRSHPLSFGRFICTRQHRQRGQDRQPWRAPPRLTRSSTRTNPSDLSFNPSLAAPCRRI